MRLKTDYVDVLALHDPSPTDVGREEVVRALEDTVSAGKARAVGVAGDVEALVAAAAGGIDLGVAQFSAKQIGEVKSRLRDLARPVRLITHSISKVNVGGGMNEKLEAALLENRQGTVLVSMYSKTHLKDNLATLAGVQI